MIITAYSKALFLSAVLLAAALPVVGEAGTMGDPGAQGNAGLMGQPRQQSNRQCVSVTKRPLSDFLTAQGTRTTFFPPVKDYVGWVDGSFEVFALVDYAGLANKYITSKNRASLGTKVVGYVKECQRANGSALVTVGISTTRALGFAQTIAALEANNFDFLNTPTFFGVKAQDVKTPTDAAVGPASLTVSFAIEEAGGALPDLLDVIVDNPPGTFVPVSFSFSSSSSGNCTGDGDARRGRKARMHIHQAGATDDTGSMVYTAEKIDIEEAGGGNCRN